MNQPSKGKMGKLIKSCFQPSKGKLFVCSDFSALEDYVNTLLTRDRNKMRVYLDGFDGHCLRAATFNKDAIPDITQTREEILKQGQTYKVTYSDGSVDYFNEYNPILRGLMDEF